MIIVTPLVIADLKMGLARNIRDGNKSAAAGSLYNLSVNVGQFIGDQGEDLLQGRRDELCEDVLKYAKQVNALPGGMDESDTFIWGEALDHMRLSFEDRCPRLLKDVTALARNETIQQYKALVPDLSIEPR